MNMCRFDELGSVMAL